MATQHFKLEKLNCPSCIAHIESLEDDLPGISKIDADFRKSAMKVEYDESKQSTASIMAAVSEMGYIAIPHTNADDSQDTKPLWKKLFR